MLHGQTSSFFLSCSQGAMLSAEPFNNSIVPSPNNASRSLPHDSMKVFETRVPCSSDRNVSPREGRCIPPAVTSSANVGVTDVDVPQ